MSHRYRVLFAAFVGLILISAILAGFLHLKDYRNEHADQRQEAAHHKVTNAHKHQETTCIDLAKKLSFPCVPDTQNSDDGGKYTDYDLQAQQEMAEWALAMAMVSALSVFATIIATVYVALTWRETRKIVADAERATRAAQDTVVITRDTAKRQLRAYVGIQSIELRAPDLHTGSPAQDPSIPGTYADNTVAVTIKNFGQTPAVQTTLFCWWSLFTGRPSEHRIATLVEDEVSGDVRTAVSRLMLDGGSTHTIDRSIWSLDHWQMADRGDGILYVFGRIYYRDAFEVNRRRFFCYEWTGSNRGTFIPYEHYNGEDECDPPVFPE